MPRKRDDISHWHEHKPFISKEEVKAEVGGIKKRQIIRFTYDGKIRNVFVVHPMWEGLVHGLDLKRIKRKEFLTVVNSPLDLTEHQLYEHHIKNSPRVQEADAYRCYNPAKMNGLRTVVYDSTLQGTEKAEPGIKEPEMTDSIQTAQKQIRDDLSKQLDDSMKALRQSMKKTLGK